MESKEYFEKIMQDYNQNGKGRSLRKYCKDEAVDYNWLIEFRKTYPARSNDREKPASAEFIPLEVEKSKPQQACWQVSQLTLLSPEGQAIEIKRLQAEDVRLSNELARHKNYVQFLQEENGKIEEEV